MKDKIKVYLQSPWRKGGECSYYKFLREDLPNEIEFVNKEPSTIIQNKKKLKLNNFAKKWVKKLIRNFLPSLPNAHKSPQGNYDLIHCAHCLSKNKNKPWVADIEYPGQLWASGRSTDKISSKKEVLKILKSDNCKKILPWTKWVMDEIIKEFPEVKNKVKLLYPGIPMPKNVMKTKSNKTVLLYASRRFYFKGGLYAIEVMDKITKSNQNVEGWIVSDVPKEVYEKYKKNKQINFIGMVPQKRLFEEIYPAADIFLYPSFTDTFGFGITEAMSFGLPVVCCDGHSREEIVEDEKTGFVVETKLGDHVPNSFLESLQREDIIKNLGEKTRKLVLDKNLRNKMSKNCIKVIKEGKFSIKIRNKKLKRIYEEALKK